jgi:hypothetical protein
MEIHKPGNRVVREARKIADQEGRRGVRDFGAEIVKALTAGDDDERAIRRARQLAKEQEYDPAQFDRDALLCSAITRWSYVDPETGKELPVTPERIADLDEETARWAHLFVVDLIKPTTQEALKSDIPPAASGA